MSVGDINSNEKGSGARYNSGKTRYDLIPLSSLKPCADVFEYGAEKYAAWNWAKGMHWSVPYASLLRHLRAWYEGEDVDEESGLPHLGHMMCNLIMLAHYAENFQEGDDRPPRELFNKPEDQCPKEINDNDLLTQTTCPLSMLKLKSNPSSLNLSELTIQR